MEPIKLCRHKESGPYGVWWPGDPAGDGGDFDYLLALPRAEYDALVAEMDALRGRDRTCPLCGDELTPDEMDYDSDVPPMGAGVCSECFGRWHDAPIYEKRAEAATARAERAEAEARTVGIPIHRHDIAARIDALLDTPTDDDGRGDGRDEGGRE